MGLAKAIPNSHRLSKINQFTLNDNHVDAQKHIDKLESGTYYLQHGEMGRPTYTIKR